MGSEPGPAGRQCILPPHMLEAIELRGSPEQRAMARAMQQEAEAYRVEREDETPARAGVAASRLGAGTAEVPVEARQEIYDCENEATLPGTLVRVTGDDPVDDEVVDQAFDSTQATHDFLREVYKRDSLDGDGMTLVSSVRYRRDYNNAFWNGHQMVYGDGDGIIFKPLSGSLSVVGHELAHGVVQHSGGLVYRDEPGALNEHCADVLGALTVQYTRGELAHEADWLIGAEILGDDIAGEALRSLRAPGTAYDDDLIGTDPQPYHMDGFVLTTSDHGGVHVNSGIPNHAFFLLAQLLGGKAWETPGRIWYDALLAIRNPHARFAEFADRTVEAARDRFGPGSIEARLTRRAWKLVGIDL